MSEHYSFARLRKGVLHFLFGKAGSALLTFAGFLLVARLLQPADYGRYVSLVALVELGLNLASLGLDWVSTRYIPAFRVHAGGAAMARFVLRLALVQAGALAGTAVLIALAAPWLTALLGLGNAVAALRLYAAYLLIEGLSRVLRDQILGQLLLQGRAQAALLCRHLVWVAVAAWLWFTLGQATLLTIAMVELGAATLGLLLAVLGLGLALRRAAQEAGAAHPDWIAPTAAAMRHLAVNSYLALLLNIPARPQILTLLVTRLLGVEAAALFGFARGLADQVLRFLPAELLLGFVRPALVARYVQSRSFVDLNVQTNGLLVISLLVLCPVLALVLGRGEPLVHVLGAGRFDGSELLLALMLIGAALFSQRRMLEFVANTVDRPQAVSRASIVLLAVPLVVLMLLRLGAQLWMVPTVSLLFELGFSGLAAWQLRSMGIPYRLALAPAARCAAVLALASAALALMPTASSALPTVWFGVLAVIPLTAALIWLLRPLDAATLAAARRLLGKGGS